MNKLLIALGALALVIGAFFAFNSYIYHEKQADNEVMDESSEDAAIYKTFTSREAGMAFEYKTEPDGYVVDDVSAFIGEEDQGIEVTHVYRIMNEREKIELENSEGGREGPPIMQVMVFRNERNQSASMWVDAFPVFSNIGLVLGEVDRDAVVGGANAVRYRTDGLYVADNVVVAHGDFIYHFIGQYLEANSTIHQDFKRLIDSIVFIPAETETTPTANAKIDVRVACESALAYMLFRTQDDADTFVAECIAGEHPDVIERYIESLEMDGAAI